MTILEIMYQRIYRVGLGQGFGSTRLKLGAVKMFQDGSIQGLTGALSEPYHNKPGYRGDLINTQEDLERMVEKYHAAGLQIAVHAMETGPLNRPSRLLRKPSGFTRTRTFAT